MNKKILHMEDFKQQYIKKFERNLADKMSPVTYLVHQTVIQGDKQLNLISHEINSERVLFVDMLNQNKKQPYSGEAIEVEYIGLPTGTHSKSSKQITIESNILEEDFFPPNTEEEQKSAALPPTKHEDKRKAFKESRFGTTQFLSYKYIKKEKSKKREKLKLNTSNDGKTPSEALRNLKLKKSISHKVDELQGLPKSLKCEKTKSFKAPTSEVSGKTLKIEIKEDQEGDFQSIQTAAKSISTDIDPESAKNKNKYRRERNSKIWFMDQNFLIKTVSANEGKRNYKGGKLLKSGGICTQEGSPCNVSKNMRKVNNETFGSKKFLQGIEADSTNRNYEIVKRDSVREEVNSAPLVLHREASKENAKLVGTNEHKVRLDVKTEKRKGPRAPKQALKRGMTVKFQGNEDIL